MPFSVVSNKSKATYFLHAKVRKSKDGREVPFYYFSKTEEGALPIDKCPEGHEVAEMPTGMPLLKRTAK